MMIKAIILSAGICLMVMPVLASDSDARTEKSRACGNDSKCLAQIWDKHAQDVCAAATVDRYQGAVVNFDQLPAFRFGDRQVASDLIVDYYASALFQSEPGAKPERASVACTVTVQDGTAVISAISFSLPYHANDPAQALMNGGTASGAEKHDCEHDDLSCINNEIQASASVTCANLFEARYPRDIEWDDSWLMPKFSPYKWAEPGKTALYYSKYASIQLPNGNFVRADVVCVLNVLSGNAYDIGYQVAR